MSDATAEPAGLIAGRYAVLPACILAHAGAGVSAYAVQDRRRGIPSAAGSPGLMALAIAPDAPPRSSVLTTLLAASLEGLLAPLAQGAAPGADGMPCWYVISEAPPGPPLWSREIAASPAGQKPWTEAELLGCVLRPVAAVLEGLAARHITHRGIRPDNLFRAGGANPGSREPVTIGQCWAAPPASLQPALYEPPYMSLCHPAGRGDGSIADDIYALGVTMLVLALGGTRLVGLDAAAITRRKLELGSFAAIAGDERLPPIIADLARGMLAEDPEHRPPPALLADPGTARGRRVAARPPRRAQRPLEVGEHAAWTARTLAHTLASSTAAAPALLRSGAVDRWARRSLGDPAIAASLEELIRHRATETDDERADALMTMKAIAVLDPLAPLCWQGVAIWPDGLGPMLAASTHDAATTDALLQLVGTEAATAWAAMRAARCDAGLIRLDGQQHRALLCLRGWGGGPARLRYALNPAQPCRAKLLRQHLVMRPSELLPALEAIAAAQPASPARATGPVDRDIAAFLAARGEMRAESELSALTEGARPEAVALVHLRLLAGLQRNHGIGGVPALAAWLLDQAGPAVAAWQSRTRRDEMARLAGDVVATGDLAALTAVLDDQGARQRDAQEAQQAALNATRIDQDLAGIAEGGPRRRETARRIGLETAGALSAMALAASAVAAVLS